jgi:hypothetical protein
MTAADDVLVELNEIVRPDGAELVIRSQTESALLLELDLTNSSCPECVVPKDLLVDILRAKLAKAAPDIRDVDLLDAREHDAE